MMDFYYTATTGNKSWKCEMRLSIHWDSTDCWDSHWIPETATKSTSKKQDSLIMHFSSRTRTDVFTVIFNISDSVL